MSNITKIIFIMLIQSTANKINNDLMTIKSHFWKCTKLKKTNDKTQGKEYTIYNAE